MVFSEAVQGIAEGISSSDHLKGIATPCTSEPLLNTFYKLRASDKYMQHLLPAEIALVQQRSDM